ncbi:MAG: type II secretion system F family protein [Beijerinckiaceae bacterium]
MEAIFSIIDFLVSDPLTLLFAAVGAVFAGAVALAAQWASVRGQVKRRAGDAAQAVAGAGPVRAAALPPSKPSAILERIISSVNGLFGEGEDATSKVLRSRLVQAGYYSQSAPAVFLTVRIALMVALGAAGFIYGMVADMHITQTYMWMVAGAGLGYMAPPMALNQIVKARMDEHRSGFPDFLDLMIVCCEAGLSMEASINRVCREMADAYPSLSANLYFATLEIRAGRSVNDAFANLAHRLGIEEARTFATLLQQSAELGSSLIDSLRIYSDDMRNKRMMRAEEKANQLPSKMVIPMMIFIFPILFLIMLFPAYMAVKETFGQ